LEDEDQTGELKKFLAPCGEPRIIHSSGHAPPELLRALARAVNPRKLLPIHGQAWREHQAEFENLQIMENGQWLEI
jgi:mRNA degradation ribonuclease J1/J2